MKFLFCDTETTGLSPEKGNALVQCHFRFYDGETKAISDHSFKCRPHADASVDSRALEVQGVTYDEIMSWPDPHGVAAEVRAAMTSHGKLHFVAYNAPFDEAFLQSFLRRNGQAYPRGSINWPIIDIASICSLAIGDGRLKMENFKLPTVYAAIMGKPLDKAHSALGDCVAIYELFRTITNK